MSTELAALRCDQSGVLTRQQLTSLGVTKPTIERMLRHHDLVRVLPGVFVNHTGPLSWIQRAWVGTLYFAPAALAGASALRATSGLGVRGHDDAAAITVAVATERHVQAADGFRVIRVRGLAQRVQWHAHPPRLRIEEALLDVASAQGSDFAALEVLAEACRSRRTTPRRLLDTLAGRSRLKRRAWMREVLEEIAEGSTSVLEHGYGRLVERPHGLPRSRRQGPFEATLGRIYHDVNYEDFGLVLELDGRLFHDAVGQRDRDLDRDLDLAVVGRRTVRLGWGQIFGRGCETAARIATLLRLAGWPGVAVPCGPGCTLQRKAAS